MRYFLFFLISFLFTLSAQAQKMKEFKREISLYNVLLKTDGGNVKGLLQTVDSTQVVVLTKKSLVSLQPQTIKSLKIKFDRTKTIKVFGQIAQAGFDTIVDSPLNNDGTPKSMFYDPSQPEDPDPLGPRLLLGTGLVATALIGNEVSKLVPRPTIEGFDISKDSPKYQSVYPRLSLYALDTQTSPDYEKRVHEVMKDTMKNNKLDVHR